MRKNKRYTGIVSLIYAVAVILTLFSFMILAFSESQLAELIISAVILGAAGIYGRSTAVKLQKTKDTLRIHRQHLAELQDIRELAGTWRHPGAEWLTELVTGLEERFQYSAPVSHSSLFAIEVILTQQISLLHDQVSLLMTLQRPGDNWEESASELAESISATLQRRNMELAALK
ncbi:hypothetical protein [Paenibacillus tianjinensis]|uniref:Uncharacterized protein n=1 Tax=Paenibacillus tianjinensis TaxID=2810347 RepID=A0ABX7LBB0_9BACL|nr:hypothetical protein [Paenibacillus tianjinensis]QSF44068.1 hypothetical protein JRJ22_23020 [Paenibacillus tianjinensis]